jgi:hypothetical protein
VADGVRGAPAGPGVRLPVAAQPQNFGVICGFLAIEQFGYGFGFTAMMMYMIMVADGRAQDGALRDLHRPDGAGA